ncbi:hypothetical protein PAPYR_2968 [Paratrimastix pyriformis]|uniref:Lipocalin n=1 Tax=Paratrimastix pyriformis TaxID=342808 RepID=A0ABQ8UNI5_9EUKA|nr:hypothetical protein PAPYR_2968 [Paratrimastix pyriformis]
MHSLLLFCFVAATVSGVLGHCAKPGVYPPVFGDQVFTVVKQTDLKTGSISYLAQFYDYPNRHQRYDMLKSPDFSSITMTYLMLFDKNTTFIYDSKQCTASKLDFPMEEPDFLKDARYCGLVTIDDTKCQCWAMPNLKYYVTADTCEPIPIRATTSTVQRDFSQYRHEADESVYAVPAICPRS